MSETTSTTFNKNTELRDIQGGVFGFNKDHQRFIHISFSDAGTGKQLLTELTPQLSRGFEVVRFNEAFGANNNHGGDPDALQATWVNVWLTHSGLAKLGAPGLETFPAEFNAGMAGRADVIGDVGASAPGSWVAPFTGGAEPDATILVAGDNMTDLDVRLAKVNDIITRHSGTVLGQHDGEARQGEGRGKEHFGFRDGISQPAIDRFTTEVRNGGTIPAGDVLIGYTDSEGHVSGEAVNEPTPPATGYNPAPTPPPAQPMPAWARNGTFVVMRRLQQDVGSFKAAMEQHATQVALAPEQLAAKTIGRWPSGAPMERVPGMPVDAKPGESDPSVGEPNVLNANKVNKFDFSDDADGLNVPRAAHIRKMNPRADVLPDGDTAAKHRMVRRGITYGPDFVPGEPAYGGQPVSDNRDRGLMFVCYQSSIARIFEFVQSRWANRDDFQKPGDGSDPIISQNTPNGTFSVPPHGAVTFERWVTTTGGAYYFAPSISGLKDIAGQADEASTT